MRVALVLIAFGATGCDVVYGLSGRDSGTDTGDAAVMVDAEPCPDDRDCDFVLDIIDNCLDVANSDQRDLDEDGIGDRCDACSAIRTMTDEDSDSTQDPTDTCPSVFNYDQLDSDGDGVGEVCDPNTGGSDAISCFFAFGDVDETTRLWSVAAPWSVQSGRLVHTAGASAPSSIAHIASALVAGDDAYLIEAPIQVSASPLTSIEVGIGVGQPGLAAPTVRCVLDGTFQAAPMLSLLDASNAVLARMAVPVLVTADQRITLQFERGSTSFTCSLRDGGTTSIVSATGAAVGEQPTALLISENATTAFPSLTIYRLAP